MSQTEFAFDENPDPLEVTNLSEIVTLVPYLLGFVPADSLVVLGTGDPPGPLMRVDLAPADRPIEVRDAVASATGERIASVMQQNRVPAVFLFGYGDSEPVTAFGTIVETELHEAGIRVLQGVRVQDDRFWSFTCTDPECCPLDGTPLNSQNSITAAEATWRGFSIAANREEIEASLDPVSGLAADRMGDAIRKVSDHLNLHTQNLDQSARRLYLIEQGEALIDSIYERVRLGVTFEKFDDLEIAQLLILLQELYNRDLAMIGIGVEHAAQFLEFWTHVLRRATPGLASAPACLTAQAAICRGEGVIADAALNRGAEDAPDTPLLIVLRNVVHVGANPHDLPIITREELAEAYSTEIQQLRRDALGDDGSNARASASS